MCAKRAITMGDIAKLANVSKPTVSRALSNSPLINPDTRQHVLSIARHHGYAVNRNAQKLRQKRTNTIAVSLDFLSHRNNHISDPFIFDLLAGVSEALGNKGQDLLLCAPIHNDTEALQQILSSRGADGIIVLGQGHREEMLYEFVQAGAPIVVWGAVSGDKSYCVVGSDNYLGGQLAGRYFLEKNRSRFLFIGDTTFREFNLRLAGLRNAADESAKVISINSVALSNFSFESAYNSAKTYLATSADIPDAIFALSDTVAMAYMRACRDIGLGIPQQVSVVGYNDIPSAAYFSPPLTTIRQDTYQAGRQLVSKLMQILDGIQVDSATIMTELIVRDT